MPESAKRYTGQKPKGGGPKTRLVKLGTHESRRGSAHARGYNARWQKCSKLFLREHPTCAECERHGFVSEATLVDHIIPHRGNEGLFWDQDNWQALCDSCHNRKTGKGQ